MSTISIRCAARLLWMSVGLLAGCGGGDGRLPYEKLAQVCALPRSGVDPDSGRSYPDQPGTLADEQAWLDAYLHQIYLWNQEIPQVDAAQYGLSAYASVPAALDAYFKALLTPARTASGKRKDQFSFTADTAAWNAQSQSGISLGYGLQLILLARSPPREAVVASVEPQSPADALGLARGTRILAIDDVDLVNDGSSAGVATLNAGLFPAQAGEQHRFRIQDPGSTATRELLLTAQPFTEIPVPLVKTFDTAEGKLGYLLFNDHIATAEGELFEAVQSLAAAGIRDLVLDLRYNRGGYLDIASELAFMIAGAEATRGQVFEQLRFNAQSRRTQVGEPRTPFHTQAQGYDPSLPEGTALPQLNLKRLFVLASGNTCSASEAIINGLRGIDIEVVLIGQTSCGKPYGFYPQDNCGTTYFAIEFAGSNAKGFGDYADGLAPDCTLGDDFGHALGDPQEALLATALQYRQSGQCPSQAKQAALGGQLLDSPLHRGAWHRR